MYPHHLAWHETLELHELVAFQSNALITLKRGLQTVRDPELRQLYVYAIREIEKNLHELLPFYSVAPHVSHYNPQTPYMAGKLLGISKNAIKNYGNAITEIATPALRKVLTKQLNRCIRLHAKVFNYMYQRSYYPAYDLDRLLYEDQRNADRALRMPF